jgi:ribosomal protein L11 methyltransferase
MSLDETKWYSVAATVRSESAVAIEHAFNELGALGTEIDQLRKRPDEDVTVIGYFDQQPAESEIRSQIDLALEAFGFGNAGVSVRTSEVKNEDWLAEWKKHWRPTRVGRFVIAPSWYAIDEEPNTILIRIEPNMAFGTGTHETTKLCLKAIDELYQPEMSFLDVGTGTGILAIAVAKMNDELFTGKITGIELDPESVSLAREKAQANDVSARVEVVHGVLTDDIPQHDFVCANVTLDVISPMLPLLLDKSCKHLILSGILAEQETQITRELQALGIDSTTVERDGEWIAVRIDR